MAEEVQILVTCDKDVVTARQQGRATALAAGFSNSEATLVATAISELARNIVSYANRGTVTVARLNGHKGAAGLKIVASDAGPGIADVAQALRDGYSSSGGLGLGLPGVRRLMDDFDIASVPGSGTTVTVTKWLK
ncbi:MAG TPA: ATP-binding protein [Steroidobacteraceae bacterium]|nr:ATP-binding protein [Gammaproteobacteria bacterium]HEV2285924.1 ATP-binding protein [Steroidobacteraceae bacterium]